MRLLQSSRSSGYTDTLFCRKNASWGCPHVDYEDIADTKMHQSTKRGNPVTGYTKVKINKILE